MKIGFIGFGSMGSMLINGLITHSHINQENIIITRKNKEKLKDIKDIWQDIKVTVNAAEVVAFSDIIFICVKPLEYRNVLEEIKTLIKPSQNIVSIAGSLKIEDMERIVSCKITKLMPTVVSEVKEGITLICYNDKVTSDDIKIMEALLNTFTMLMYMKEEYFGLATEFTSCGPGLYAAMLQEFAEAGVRHSDSLSKEEIRQMILQTMLGTVKFMLDKDLDFTDVIQRVATKGGITEEGVSVIQKTMPQVFDEMIDVAMKKRKVIDEKIHTQFII